MKLLQGLPKVSLVGGVTKLRVWGESTSLHSRPLQGHGEFPPVSLGPGARAPAEKILEHCDSSLAASQRCLNLLSRFFSVTLRTGTQRLTHPSLRAWPGLGRGTSQSSPGSRVPPQVVSLSVTSCNLMTELWTWFWSGELACGWIQELLG